VWSSSPNLKSVHGFSLRDGGVSRAQFESLNLSERVGDDIESVRENRRRALDALGLDPTRLARLTQVHSSTVLEAQPGETPEGDALVTTERGLALVIETADCFPLLLEDTEAGVVAAAHAGWRGTVAGIAARTVEAMLERGARAERIRAAIGPGICGDCYEVGPEVRDAFLQAGFPGRLFQKRLGEETESGPSAACRLDLREANAWLLRQIGVPRENIWASNDCSTGERYFSYRRDGGRTGRSWSVIAREAGRD
jgi:YfiH family protein